MSEIKTWTDRLMDGDVYGVTKAMLSEIEELRKALAECDVKTSELDTSSDMIPGWVRACDEEMLATHLGVADLSDSYASAKAKLNALICWHVAVATDPAVNGGYQLVPLEPR